MTHNLTLQEQIALDLKSAIKKGETTKKNLLRVVIGEFNRIDKILSDDIATKEIKKMYNNALELKNQEEADILAMYIPSELSDSELESIIVDLIEEFKIDSKAGMKIVMGHLKDNYPNRYDGKKASQLFFKLINSK